MLRSFISLITKPFVGLRSLTGDVSSKEIKPIVFNRPKKKNMFAGPSHMDDQPDKQSITEYYKHFEEIGVPLSKFTTEIKITGTDKYNVDILCKVLMGLNKIKKEYIEEIYWHLFPEGKLEEKAFYTFAEENKLEICQAKLFSNKAEFEKMRLYLEKKLKGLEAEDEDRIKNMYLDKSMSDEVVEDNIDSMSKCLGLLFQSRIQKPLVITNNPWVYKLARLIKAGQPGLVEQYSVYYENVLLFKTREEFPDGRPSRRDHFREGWPPSVEEEPFARFCVTIYIYRFLYALWNLRGVLEIRRQKEKEISEAYMGPQKASVSVGGVEGRYATALYSAAVKQIKLELVQKEIKNFQRMLKRSAIINEYVLNPFIQNKEKIDIILSVLKYSDLTTNFITLLAENNRLGKIDGIISAFDRKVNAHIGKVLCVVTLAKPLSAVNRDKLRLIIDSFLKDYEFMQLDTKIDPRLIGGMTVHIGEKYVDMSIAAEIKTYTNLIKQPV